MSEIHELARAEQRYSGTMKVLRGREWVNETVERGDRSISSGSGINSVAPADDGDWIVFPYASGSDYSGDSVTAANYRTLLAEHGAILITMSYAYGGYGILAHVDDCREDGPLWDALDDLDRYPILDDDDHNEIEREAEIEAWDSWLADDVRHKIDPDDLIDWCPDAWLYNAFEEEASDQNEYWINEMGNSAWIDFERVIERAASAPASRSG